MLNVAAVEAVEFSVVEQAVRAVLRDRHGSTLQLKHPYTVRSRSGTEALFTYLQKQLPSFVAGPISPSATGPVIEPVSLVFESGSTRTMLQPWVEAKSARSEGGIPENTEPRPPHNPLHSFLEQAFDAVAELLVIGLTRADERTLRQWRSLRDYGASLGLVRVLEPIERFTGELDNKLHRLDWDTGPAIRYLLEFVVFAKTAQELLI